ncbi:MAG: transcription elongation factor GreA [Parcubacteria group bacterium]|nr:transcription elongation factor GreA [Parcubacteria group bacterium]
MEEKHFLSQEKHDALTAELADLKTRKRREIAEKLEYAKSLGDLSENSEYQEARESQAAIEERISTIETVLKSAEIVADRGGDTIDIGSTVTLRKANSSGTQTYKLVGSEEADIADGKISNHSPLGEALLGKKTGDTVRYLTPNGEASCTIVKVT